MRVMLLNKSLLYHARAIQHDLCRGPRASLAAEETFLGLSPEGHCAVNRLFFASASPARKYNTKARHLADRKPPQSASQGRLGRLGSPVRHQEAHENRPGAIPPIKKTI